MKPRADSGGAYYQAVGIAERITKSVPLTEHVMKL